jgi:DegV family protein with EDD domain
MNVRIVTDSAVYLAPDVARELGIVVVPHHVRIGDREYVDGVDLGEDEYYHLSHDYGLEMTCSSPTADEFYRVYDWLKQDVEGIISIHLAEELSDAVNQARQAANMLLGQCNIVVLDSQTISMGLGILTQAAARAAADNMPLDDIVRVIRGLIPRIYIVFFSESLDSLERGGRLGHAQALLGTMLGIKPFLTLEEGKIQPMEKVRTRQEAIEKLIEFVSEFDDISQMAIIKGSASPVQEIPELIEQLHDEFPDVEVPVISYGPVLASHVGWDTLGIIVYENLGFQD